MPATFYGDLALPSTPQLLLALAAVHAFVLALPSVHTPLIAKVLGRGVIGSLAVPLDGDSFADYDALFALFIVAASQYVVALALAAAAFERDVGAALPLPAAAGLLFIGAVCAAVQPRSGGVLVIAVALLAVYRALRYGRPATAAAAAKTPPPAASHPRIASYLLLAVGAWHTLGTFLFPLLANPVVECVRAGLLDCTASPAGRLIDRAALLWFLVAGACWMLLGWVLAAHAAATGRATPRPVAVCVLAFGAPALVVPNSGFCLFLALGAYMLLAPRPRHEHSRR